MESFSDYFGIFFARDFYCEYLLLFKSYSNTMSFLPLFNVVLQQEVKLNQKSPIFCEIKIYILKTKNTLKYTKKSKNDVKNVKSS